MREWAASMASPARRWKRCLRGSDSSSYKVWRTSVELNQVKAPRPADGSRAAVYLAEITGRGGGSRTLAASSLRLKLFSRIAVVRQIAGSLVVLGLIGTVLGFIIALSGVEPTRAADVQAISPMVATLIQGMSVALYTTLVAVMRDNEPQIGVIFAPAAGEMVFAERGQGCWHMIDGGTPRRAQVSNVAQWKDAVFVTTSVRAFTTGRARDARRVYDQLQTACRVTRTWGDAFGYLLVATGRAEVMIDPVMNLWDTAALQPVIEEAGGEFFDWQGAPTVHSGESVATNAALARQVLKIISG